MEHMEKMSKMQATLPLLLLLISASQAGKTGIGQKVDLALTAKVSDEITLGIRGGGYWGNHREQIDQIQSEFDSTGLSGTEYALTGTLYLGTFGKAVITGTGEIAIYNRGITDSTLTDSVVTPLSFREYLPRTGINIRVPVAGGFAVEFNNLFERRLITKPSYFTFWVWRPQIRIAGPSLTALKISPYVDYEGSDHKDLRYMATTSYGVKSEPMKGLTLGLSDHITWFPDKPDNDPRTVHVITLRAEYGFDLTGKK